jgi:hypothetical protein
MKFDLQPTADKLLNAQISILQSVIENEKLNANIETKKLIETEKIIQQLQKEQDKLHLYMTMSYGETLHRINDQLSIVQKELATNQIEKIETEKHHSLLLFEISWIENEIKDLKNKVHRNSNST